MPSGRKYAILTCMDSRLAPAKYTGIAEGEAYVIRNAGGRATDDAIRSLVISHKLLGTEEWFVVHHTDCGMEKFTNDIMGNLCETSLQTASFADGVWSDSGDGGGSVEGRYINWMTIADQGRSVLEDVRRIRSHPLVDPAVPIYGYIVDVNTGELEEVPEASEAGRPLS